MYSANMHIVDKGNYSLVSMGKIKRILPKEIKLQLDLFLELLEQHFNQKTFSVYINEDKNDPSMVHGINIVFRKIKEEQEEPKDSHDF